LQRLVVTTGLSKTDIVNRAISMYEYIDAQIREGYDLTIRNLPDWEAQRLGGRDQEP
jgi:hypothetical protein